MINKNTYKQESFYISPENLKGRSITIDWKLPTLEHYAGINNISELSRTMKNWVLNKRIYKITAVNCNGIKSTVVLDERLTVSIYRIKDIDTDNYFFRFNVAQANQI